MLSCVAPWVCNSPLNLGVVGSSKPDCLFLQCVAKVSIFDARFHQTVEIHWLLNGWSSVFPPPAKVLFPLVLSTQSAIFAVTPRNPRLPPKIPPTNQPPQKNQQQQHKKTKEAKTKTNPRCCLLLWASEHKAKKKPAFQPLFVFLSPFFTFSPPLPFYSLFLFLPELLWLSWWWRSHFPDPRRASTNAPTKNTALPLIVA